ncbi:hypothetical protein OR16_24690, partial [Cupriavidus basilensis OR16]
MKRQALALLAAATAVAAAALPLSASAQANWPGKPITYVVPFPPGGTTDTLARLIGQRLGQALGTTVVVENRPGAGGNIGSDYAPITLIGTNANVLVVSASSPFKTVKDIVTEAKAKPDTLAFASAGNGTSQHLAGELFKSLAGIKITHIPYKGSGPAIQDVMAGQVPMMFDTTVVAAQHIDSGKLRALAVTSAQRIKSMPNVPTMAEAGVSGYELESWQAIFAPA